uniref:non-specific serine/threonine protein kinase n=1 Tax=Cyprinus carpio carpio TaxID=630221 RepID=A0A9J7ZIU7_CYPCA
MTAVYPAGGGSVGVSEVATGPQRYARWSRQDSSDICTDDEGTQPRRLTPLEKLNLDMCQDEKMVKELTVGRRIGFYKIRGEIGCGNFSHVKLGIHALTKDKVAIKILDKTKLDQKTQRLLSREISSMETLHHPNIIRLYEVVETLTRLHLVMEYASGGELYTKISTEGKLSDIDSKIVFSQVLSAVKHMMLSAMDTEDFLSSLLGEEEDGLTINCLSQSPHGSDSGISEDTTPPYCQSPPDSSETDTVPSPGVEPLLYSEYVTESYEAQVVQTDHCYTLPQGTDALLSVRSENPESDVFIDVDDLDDSMEDDFSPELPCSLTIEDSTQSSKPDNQFQFKEIVLTDEERRLLTKEGATIPTHMPLTKAEERTLKRVRRKIRNKQSAQESRKKKKVYVDGLENRVAICTAHNQELQKKVEMLQKQNISLIEQLRKLQAMVKMSTMKTTTTSTCIMVFLLSFCLIIFPSVNPFGSSNQKDLYTSSTGMSRALRSYPAVLKDDIISTSAKEVPDQDVLLMATVENNQVLLSGGQNHTPDYQRVEQSDSESGVNNNSSADFPTPDQSDLKADGSLSESHRNSAAVYDSQSKTKESWMEQKPTSVIIQQHRSDEM